MCSLTITFIHSNAHRNWWEECFVLEVDWKWSVLKILWTIFKLWFLFSFHFSQYYTEERPGNDSEHFPKHKCTTMSTIYTSLAPQCTIYSRHAPEDVQNAHTTCTARYTCTQVARGVQQRATATKHDQTCFSAGLCFWRFLKHLVHVCNHKHRW